MIRTYRASFRTIISWWSFRSGGPSRTSGSGFSLFSSLSSWTLKHTRDMRYECCSETFFLFMFQSFSYECFFCCFFCRTGGPTSPCGPGSPVSPESPYRKTERGVSKAWQGSFFSSTLQDFVHWTEEHISIIIHCLVSKSAFLCRCHILASKSAQHRYSDQQTTLMTTDHYISRHF